MIISRLDRVMADRKISLNELAEKSGNNQCQSVKTEDREGCRSKIFHT